MVKLICGPMATLSHEAFRRSVEKFGGCDEYFTEMINCSSLINMGPFEKYYLLNGPVPEKIIWQLTGWDADQMAKAVPVVLEKGGMGIDLNMGCSAPQIYKTGAGISWMTKPIEQTKDLVQKVRSQIDRYNGTNGTHFELSVKCRLGPEDFTPESFFSFTDMLVENGVEKITLHPRTQKEKVRGTPRWDFAEQLAIRHPETKIILNGAICDYATASAAIKKCPHVWGLMIAREAAIKPWIFDQIKSQMEWDDTDGEYSKSHEVDRKQVALDFIDDVVRYQPVEFHKTRIQRFFSYYCQQFSFGHYFQSRMLNYKSVEESIQEVEDYFAKLPDDRILRY